MKANIAPDEITIVKDLDIKDLVPTKIEEIAIAVKDNRREIRLPYGFIAERFVTWKRRRGGVFYKDIFNWTRGREHGKYISIKGKNIDYIVRIIEDEELQDFEVRRLVHGKIKDKPFMILHNLHKTAKKDKYIEEDLETPENNTESNIPQVLDITADTDTSKSKALFE